MNPEQVSGNQSFDLFQRSAIYFVLAAFWKTHATKNDYRRFLLRLYRNLCDLGFRPHPTPAGDFSSGFIQKPGINV
jgi:hypothetical protein